MASAQAPDSDSWRRHNTLFVGVWTKYLGSLPGKGLRGEESGTCPGSQLDFAPSQRADSAVSTSIPLQNTWGNWLRKRMGSLSSDFRGFNPWALFTAEFLLGLVLIKYHYCYHNHKQ